MGIYNAAHIDHQGAGDARPTAFQIIEDEGLKGKLVGKVIVITGATSGIGYETARALSATGATLLLTARDLAKAKITLKDLLEPGRVSLVSMDHNSLKSVREAARTMVEATSHKINILIANAGVMGVPNLQYTEDGHEVAFQTNYLSHFLLFNLLKPSLLSSVEPDFNSRVVVVSSSASRSVLLPSSDNYDFQKRDYSFLDAYAASSLARVYLSNNIDRLYGGKGLHATSLHPGAINTNLSRNVGEDFVNQILSDPYIVRIMKSPEQGAATTVIAAVGKEWENKGGKYLEDCEESKRGEDDWQSFSTGWVKQTYNQEEEERLWHDSLRMLGISDDSATPERSTVR